MPLPPILKVIWFGKYGIYPIFDTIREYVRPVKSTKDPSKIEHRRFWHNPVAAVRDRRLWVKVITNVAETIVHAVGSMRFGYGFLSRRFRLFYRTWTPDHEHEHELYRQVEHMPWRNVFVRSWRWLWKALYFYEEERLNRPLIVNLSKRGKRWKKIRFDGIVIAAWVPNGKRGYATREFSRKQSTLRLRLLYGEPDMFEVMVLDGQRIVQHLHVRQLSTTEVAIEVTG